MKRAMLFLLLSITSLLCTPWAWTDEVSLEPQTAVLVLKNQQVLTGKVTRLGDFYHVALGATGEVRIPKADVQYMAATLEVVYANKATAIPARSCDGHLTLADWCIRQKMFSQAAEQLVKAMALKPRDPRIAQLEARLQTASQPTPEKKVVLQEKIAATVGRDQLERTAQELPTGTLEKFTVVIQPILMDRCGAASCHGSSSDSAFQIVQPTNTRVPSRRFTQRNLFATLSLINRENPPESALLKLARESHGDRKEAPFTREEDRQYQELKNWITSVSQNRFAANQQPQTVNARQLAGPQRQVGQASDTEVPDDSSSESAITIPLPPIEQAARDPFDPAPFNERFFKR
jgi:hypothetical protein